MAVVLRPPNQDGGMHEDRVFASIELSGAGLEEVLAIRPDVDVMKARTTEELVCSCKKERADLTRPKADRAETSTQAVIADFNQMFTAARLIRTPREEGKRAHEAAESADRLRVTRTTPESEYPAVRLPRPDPRSST